MVSKESSIMETRTQHSLAYSLHFASLRFVSPHFTSIRFTDQTSNEQLFLSTVVATDFSLFWGKASHFTLHASLSTTMALLCKAVDSALIAKKILSTR
jgi:hypothetical protein